ETAFVHEGSDLYADDILSQLAVLPDLKPVKLTEDVKAEDLDVGDSKINMPAEIKKLRDILW
ncbi:TPA: hypothetical protein N0F65_007921, partial [Lagenidium giganteum]